MQTIGLIGLGNMGFGVAKNLMKSDCLLYVKGRSREKALPLLEQGAIWCDTIAEMVEHCDILFTMVGNQFDVQDLYFDAEDAIIPNLRKDMIVIDLTTSTPDLAERIGRAAREKGAWAIDAPVTGGKTGAEEGTLFLMCGGEQKIFNRVAPLLSCIGSKALLVGDNGKGQHTKACNQILTVAMYAGLAEAVKYLTEAGLDADKTLDMITKYPYQKAVGKKMVDGDLTASFYVKHMIKDMNIVLSESERMGFELPVLALIKELYQQTQTIGSEFDGVQSLIQYYRQ